MGDIAHEAWIGDGAKLVPARLRDTIKSYWPDSPDDSARDLLGKVLELLGGSLRLLNEPRIRPGWGEQDVELTDETGDALRSSRAVAAVGTVRFSSAASEATMERAEVLKNYAAFEAMRADLETSHIGQFAVLHDGQLVGIYPSIREARTAGNAHCGIGNFSTQEIRSEPIELGMAAAVLA